MDSARFNLLMLDEGEYYIDDFVTDYIRADPSGTCRGTITPAKGRLKLCTASLFFVPEDTAIPVMRFSYAAVFVLLLSLLFAAFPFFFFFFLTFLPTTPSFTYSLVHTLPHYTFPCFTFVTSAPLYPCYARCAIWISKSDSVLRITPFRSKATSLQRWQRTSWSILTCSTGG